MANENIPKKDAQFGPWITNFAAVAVTNATELNLTTAQTTALTNSANTFATALTNSNAKKAAAKGAVNAKNNRRGTAEDLFRSTAKVILANKDIDNELKAELGLNVSPTPSGPVVPVADLAAAGFGNGENKLTWKRNGNSRSTNFLIEAKFGSSTTWTFVASTQRVRHTHSGQTPGVQVTYRIISQRGEVQSGPSNEAVVYSSSSAEIISLPLAA